MMIPKSNGAATSNSTYNVVIMQFTPTTKYVEPSTGRSARNGYTLIEGRKYSASRIRLVLTVFGEVPVFPLMPFFPPSLQPTSPLRWTHDQSPHPLQAPAR